VLCIRTELGKTLQKTVHMPPKRATRRRSKLTADTPLKPQRKRQRRPEEVKARIIEAAAAAFTRDGFTGARMRSIATEAGISIQLLVHHVKSKEVLWHTVMEQFLKRYEKYELSAKSLPDSAGSAARVRQAISGLVHFTATAPQLHRIMTHEAGQLTPRMMWLTDNLTKKNFQKWCALLEAAQRDRVVRPISAGRLWYAILAMTAVPFAVCAEYEYLTGKNPFTPGEIAKTVELICDMVLVEKA
jgi:TetR/AcrR family transcriptional regulator